MMQNPYAMMGPNPFAMPGMFGQNPMEEGGM